MSLICQRSYASSSDLFQLVHFWDPPFPAPASSPLTYMATPPPALPQPIWWPLPQPPSNRPVQTWFIWDPPPQSLLLAQDLLKLVHYIAHTYEDKRVLGLRQKGLLVSEFSGSKIIRLCMYLHEFINVAKGLNIFPRFCQK